MAGLPPDGEWMVQQVDGLVTVFHRHTEEEIVTFDPSDDNATAQAQAVIYHDDRLSPEQKSFAHFWSGYFRAHATGMLVAPRAPERFYTESRKVPGAVARVLRKVMSWTDSSEPNQGRPDVEGDITEANIVTSEIQDRPGWHAPVLDLDIPHTYVPSTTEGHGHLYLDVEITWPQMVDFLNTLSSLGIIEDGYASASVDRGYSAVRLPWIRKDPSDA